MEGKPYRRPPRPVDLVSRPLDGIGLMEAWPVVAVAPAPMLAARGRAQTTRPTAGDGRPRTTCPARHRPDGRALRRGRRPAAAARPLLPDRRRAASRCRSWCGCTAAAGRSGDKANGMDAQGAPVDRRRLGGGERQLPADRRAGSGGRAGDGAVAQRGRGGRAGVARERERRPSASTRLASPCSATRPARASRRRSPSTRPTSAPTTSTRRRSPARPRSTPRGSTSRPSSTAGDRPATFYRSVFGDDPATWARSVAADPRGRRSRARPVPGAPRNDLPPGPGRRLRGRRRAAQARRSPSWTSRASPTRT